jgi:hypothetical protein
MAAYRIEKLRLCLVIELSFGLLVALWYFIETPESPKVDVWITVIEFVAAPIWMRYFTIKGRKSISVTLGSMDMTMLDRKYHI